MRPPTKPLTPPINEPCPGGQALGDPADAPAPRAMALHRTAFCGKVDNLRLVDVQDRASANALDAPTATEHEWWMLAGEVVPVCTTPPPAAARTENSRREQAAVEVAEAQDTPVLPLPELRVAPVPVAAPLTHRDPAAPVPVHWTAVLTIGMMIAGFVTLVWSLGAV